MRKEIVAVTVGLLLTAAQAAMPICAQAAGWLKRSVGGEVLRVQAARGQRPAQDAGTIRCG